MLDVRKTATRDLASALVSKIRALQCVPVRASITLFAVTEARKGFAHRRVLVHVDMGIPAVILVAVLILEMYAVWRSVRGWFMRQRT
jgi:hypothetical protein